MLMAKTATELAELARQLGISRSKVGEAITDYLTGPPSGGTPAPSPVG